MQDNTPQTDNNVIDLSEYRSKQNKFIKFIEISDAELNDLSDEELYKAIDIIRDIYNHGITYKNASKIKEFLCLNTDFLEESEEESDVHKGYIKLNSIPEGYIVKCHRGVCIASHPDQHPKIFVGGEWVDVSPNYEELIDQLAEGVEYAST